MFFSTLRLVSQRDMIYINSNRYYNCLQHAGQQISAALFLFQTAGSSSFIPYVSGCCNCIF